jgi:hypothetical protein
LLKGVLLYAQRGPVPAKVAAASTR